MYDEINIIRVIKQVERKFAGFSEEVKFMLERGIEESTILYEIGYNISDYANSEYATQNVNKLSEQVLSYFKSTYKH